VAVILHTLLPVDEPLSLLVGCAEHAAVIEGEEDHASGITYDTASVEKHNIRWPVRDQHVV
jgi:hypothetical protein